MLVLVLILVLKYDSVENFWSFYIFGRFFNGCPIIAFHFLMVVQFFPFIF